MGVSILFATPPKNTKKNNRKTALKLFIYPQINLNKIIDTINFHNFIGGVSYSCTLGYSLAEQEQGKGYMTEALTVAIAYLFKELDMHRIMANYMQGKRI